MERTSGELSLGPLRSRPGIGTIRFLDRCAFVRVGSRLLDRRLRLVRLDVHGGLSGLAELNVLQRACQSDTDGANEVVAALHR
jgi:hypothetical protein